MSKAVFSLDNFRQEVLGYGLARNNRFEVLIMPPRGLAGAREVSLMVEQASIPLLNIFSKSVKIFGPSYQRPVTAEYGGEGLSMTFHCSSDMFERQFFEDWMHLVIDPNTFEVGYQEEYITDIVIRQLDEQDNITHEIVLLEAFPRNLNLMDLNNSSTNQTHRLNVLFAYRYWQRVGASNPDPVPRPVINPQIPVPELIETNPPTPDFSIGNPMGDVSGYGNGW